MRLKSRNVSIAAVSGNTVTGVGAGETYIDVYKDDEMKDYRGAIHTIVKSTPSQSDIIHVTSIKPKSSSVVSYLISDVFDTKTLEVTILPENATYKNVTWTSSNPEVLSVVDGVVKYLGGKTGAGNYVITAECDGKSCNFNFKASVKGTYVKRIYSKEVVDSNGTVIAKKLPELPATVPQYGNEKYCIVVEKEILGSTDYGVICTASKQPNAIKENGVVGKGVVSEEYYFTPLRNQTGNVVHAYIMAKGSQVPDEPKYLYFDVDACNSAIAFKGLAEWGYTLYDKNSNIYYWNEDRGYEGSSGGATINFICPPETYENLVTTGITVDKSWVTFKALPYGRDYSNCGIISLTVEKNTTGEDRIATLSFRGGLKYEVRQKG